MPLIDTHTHLESFARRGELETILERARTAGVQRLITIGTDADDWSMYRDIAASHRDAVSYTVGMHPCSVDEDWAARFSLIAAFFADDANPRPVALGEIGLDRFHLPKDDAAAAERIFGWQRAAFNEGLALAKQLRCPVVVHSRGAFCECVEMIDASGVDWSRVVFHCFTEGPREMSELLSRGGYGSITGIVTYKTAESLRDAVVSQGLSRLMVETDAPYLTPMPHRGKPNEPAYVRHTAEFCAKLLDVSFDELAGETTGTARRFFGLP